MSRTFSISDQPEHVRPLARAELELLCAFPDDPASLKQAFGLLYDEHQRWLEVGGEAYEPSALVRAVLTSIQNSTAQRIQAGMTALAMFTLKAMGREHSLNQAAKVVSEHAFHFEKGAFVFWQGGIWVPKKRRLVGDEATIKKNFRKYRSVAHVLTANLIGADYFALSNPFEPTPEADHCLFATIVRLQNLFSAFPTYQDWNAWELIVSPPREALGTEPLEITEELMANVLGPWLSKNIDPPNGGMDGGGGVSKAPGGI